MCLSMCESVEGAVKISTWVAEPGNVCTVNDIRIGSPTSSSNTRFGQRAAPTGLTGRRLRTPASGYSTSVSAQLLTVVVVATVCWRAPATGSQRHPVRRTRRLRSCTRPMFTIRTV